MGHRFGHPVDLLERYGVGWLMIEYDEVRGAIVPLQNGYFQAFRKDGEAVVAVGRSSTPTGAAVALWNATHSVRWGDVR